MDRKDRLQIGTLTHARLRERLMNIRCNPFVTDSQTRVFRRARSPRRILNGGFV